MLKAALVALLGFALLAWVFADSSTFQSCIQEKQHHAADDSLNNKGAGLGVSLVSRPYKICIGEFLKEYRDELLAIFTIVLAFATVFLWVATRDLANEAAESSRRELRAYVGVSPPKFGKTDPDEVSILVENGGKTPAYQVTGWLNSYWINGVGQVLPDGFDYPEQERTGNFSVFSSVAVLNAGKSIPFTFDFDFDHIRRIRNDEISLFLYGHIKYVDVFGKDQFTEFCYQYFVARDGDKIGHALVMYDEHNKAS
jgi:hypothetical protein